MQNAIVVTERKDTVHDDGYGQVHAIEWSVVCRWLCHHCYSAAFVNLVEGGEI